MKWFVFFHWKFCTPHVKCVVFPNYFDGKFSGFYRKLRIVLRYVSYSRILRFWRREGRANNVQESIDLHGPVPNSRAWWGQPRYEKAGVGSDNVIGQALRARSSPRFWDAPASAAILWFLAIRWESFACFRLYRGLSLQLDKFLHILT